MGEWGVGWDEGVSGIAWIEIKRGALGWLGVEWDEGRGGETGRSCLASSPAVCDNKHGRERVNTKGLGTRLVGVTSLISVHKNLLKDRDLPCKKEGG